MTFEKILFYLFAAVLVFAAVMVITRRNPVHAVLFLVLAFFNAAGLFVLMGAEFLGMILVVVYLGAVTVLFLFVVMMLNINVAEMRQGFLQYLPIGATVGLILLVELFMVVGGWAISPDAAQVAQVPTPPPEETETPRMREADRIPPKAAMPPAMAKAVILIRSTLMPARRAASALSPMA